MLIIIYNKRRATKSAVGGVVSIQCGFTCKAEKLMDLDGSEKPPHESLAAERLTAESRLTPYKPQSNQRPPV